MSQSVLHHGERVVDTGLARSLLRQFPAWADLPLQAVASLGTDNVIFRLGDKLYAPFPSYGAAAQQPLTDAEFLPRLAPHLPLAIPEPVALCQPYEHYPFHWTVCRWIEGKNARNSPPRDMRQAAVALAGFVAALQKIDPAGGPPAGARNFERGLNLSLRDERVRRCISEAEDLLDVPTVTALWERALAALHGAVRRSGCTAIFMAAISSLRTGGFAQSSTSAASALAIRPANSVSPGHFSTPKAVPRTAAMRRGGLAARYGLDAVHRPDRTALLPAFKPRNRRRLVSEDRRSAQGFGIGFRPQGAETSTIRRPPATGTLSFLPPARLMLPLTGAPRSIAFSSLILAP